MEPLDSALLSQVALTNLAAGWQVVEAQNLTTGQGVVAAPFACVSLLPDQESLEHPRSRTNLIEHQVSSHPPSPNSPHPEARLCT